MIRTFMTFARRAALAVALAATSGLASAGTIHVAIDTSQFGTNTGYLDMMMSASAGVPLATATISNLIGIDMANRDVGYSFGFDVVGNTYVFRNDTPNALSHAVNFGGTLSFDLTFAGDYDPVTSYISHFAVTAFDSAFQPLGHYNPATFALAEYTWTPSPVQGGQGSAGTVPEPGALLLIGVGAAGMLVARRRRSGKQAA